MRAYVFPDAALAKHAGRFVWLSIDTEKDANAAFLAKFPVDALPTLLVIDAGGEAAVLRWPGSATVAQLEQVLADGTLAAAASGDALARAARLAGEGKPAEAAAAYHDALAAARDDERPHVVESWVLQLMTAHDDEACARAAAAEAPRLPRGPSFANTVATGLGCAEEAPHDAPWRAGAIDALLPLATEAAELPDVLADDRSSIYGELADALDERGEADGARRVALRWIEFSESEAVRAPSPEARASFDPARVAAAMQLGDPARAIPPLVASERDLPSDYNAPARLALVYQKLGRLDEAVAAADRALAKVYGPRRLRLLETKASIVDQKGDHAAARGLLEEALAGAQSMPEGRRKQDLIDRLKKKLSVAR